jgi:hypothetical protein
LRKSQIRPVNLSLMLTPVHAHTHEDPTPYTWMRALFSILAPNRDDVLLLMLDLEVLHSYLSFSFLFSLFWASGYNENLSTRYSTEAQIVNPNPRIPFDSTSFASHEHVINNSHQAQSTRNDAVGLELGRPQSSTSGFQAIQPSTHNPFDDWTQNRDRGVDEFFSEEEIRIRSHEMLENEEMQQLLRILSMGGHASVNVPEDGYAFSSYVPSPMPSFDEERGRSGKAVVGWLKIKAAMRWGFFIRKKAAEKRAQLVELDDE